MVYLEILIVLALVVFNGLLALSELAVISARPARLKAARERGARGADKALALSREPGRFLSTVQIGITLVGVLSGAFSGATLGGRLAGWLQMQGMPDRYADPLGMGLVVALITYISLVVGELVPKQIALRNPEGIALKVAPAMALLSRIALPVVWLLNISGNAMLTLLGQRAEGERRVTDEEIRALIAEAEHTGTIESDERRMIAGVMRLSDRKARALMTPRGEVDWVDLGGTRDDFVETVQSTRHSLLPAAEGSVDDVVGIVKLRDLLAGRLNGEDIDPRAHVRPAPVVHDFADALDVLSMLREAEVPMALVHDEYGHFEGVITPSDILEAIAGVFRSDAEEGEREIVRREDGSWLLPGSMPVDEMADHLGIALHERGSYTTLAGFLLSLFGHLPKTGESVETHGWRLEVVDLDGRRIDQVLASRVTGSGDPASIP